MEREKRDQPKAYGTEIAPNDGAGPGAAERESFSTMVSGRGTPPVQSKSPPPSAASPPRPFAPSAVASTASQTRLSPYASGLKSADDFADDTPAPRPTLLTEPVGPPPPSSAGSVRLSLTGTGRSLRGVRVALVDTDPTRTDALAVALRARQAEVHVTSFEGDRVHMRLLRKFAPHALLIDEGVLSSTGRSLLEKLRSDPFLGHTQLFPLRFERMYKSRVGAASIETVRELLEPLGRAESELLARLGSHVEVEFELDQFPPHRLLRMLATRAAPTTIQCTREKEMLRWTVVRGRTGHAQLYRLGFDEPERLSADEALEWLLRHQNWHVVLTQPTEFDDQTGRDVIPMVERKESGLWDAPEPRPLSKRPSKHPSSTESADSLSPISLASRLLESSRWLGSSWPGSRWVESSWRKSSVRWFTVGVALSLGGAFGVAYMLGSIHEGGSLEAPAEALAVKAIDGDALPASSTTPKSVPNSASHTKTAEEGTAPVSEKAAQQEPPVQQRDPLFSVPAQHLESCQKLVGEEKGPGAVKASDSAKAPREATSVAKTHFRAAQKSLVLGQNEKAHAALCRSALLDPAGPGTLLLVQFSLAQRDFETAEFWMNQVRALRPSELVVEELWGDVLHQSGKTDEALSVWLTAFGMQAADTSKRVSVARRFAAHAATSLASGDYPRAERALRRAFSFDPNSAAVARQLAAVFARQGLTDQAERFRAEEMRLAQDL